MKYILRQLILIGLLTCYSLVSVAGHLDVLRNWLNSGSKPSTIQTANTSKPIDTKPCWVTRKHVAPAAKIDLPSPAILESDTIPDTTIRYDRIFNWPTPGYFSLRLSSPRSRAPPTT